MCKSALYSKRRKVLRLYIMALTKFLYIKLYPLCQWRFGRIIDGIRLPPHINPPRIRSGLTAAAGIFLAAKRAAYFRARGADVHIGYPTIRTRIG